MSGAERLDETITQYVWGAKARPKKAGAQRIKQMAHEQRAATAAKRMVGVELSKFQAVMAGRLKDEKTGRPRQVKGKPPRPLHELVEVGHRLLRVARVLGFSPRKSPALRETRKLVVAGGGLVYHHYLLGGTAEEEARSGLSLQARKEVALQVADAVAKRIAGNRRVQAEIVRRIREAVGGERFERMVALRKAGKMKLPPKTTRILTRLAWWKRHR